MCRILIFRVLIRKQALLLKFESSLAFLMGSPRIFGNIFTASLRQGMGLTGFVEYGVDLKCYVNDI